MSMPLQQLALLLRPLRTLRVNLLRRQRLGGSWSGSSTTTPAAFCPKKSAAKRRAGEGRALQRSGSSTAVMVPQPSVW